MEALYIRWHEANIYFYYQQEMAGAVPLGLVSGAIVVLVLDYIGIYR